MTHTTYRLTCDNCNKREFNEGDESEAELLKSAENASWTFRKVPNGAIWDLCPQCSKLKMEELE